MSMFSVNKNLVLLYFQFYEISYEIHTKVSLSNVLHRIPVCTSFRIESIFFTGKFRHFCYYPYEILVYVNHL